MDSLFDYPAEIVPIFQEMDEDLTDEKEIGLGELELDSREKMLSVGMFIREMVMRHDGLKSLKKEVDGRMKVLDNNVKRLKQWIWKEARGMEIIKQDGKGEWTGKKIESNQITIGWRKSKAMKELVDTPAYAELPNNFPQLFHFKVKPLSKDGGEALKQLQKAGLLEIESWELSKTTAKAALQKGLPIAGLKIENKINPQIKV